MKARNQKPQQQPKQKPARKSSKATGVKAETVYGEMGKIPLNQLVPCPDNVRVRKSSPKSIEKLANNIAAEGLLENLVVIEGKKGKFEVVAGERRLAALQLLVERQVLAVDALIDCKKIPRERAVSASLAENHEREDMHPADQCVAFKKLVDDGKTDAEIAARFNVTKGVVRERLALADVAMEVIDAWREDKLAMEQVEAFTVTSDHDKQRKLLQQRCVPSAWAIKRQLTESAVEGTDRRVKFVGEKAYKAAGGNVRRDLFAQGRADGLYFEDAGLLEQLAIAKLEEHAAGLRDEWAWVEVRTEFPYGARSLFGSVPTVQVEPTAEQAERIAALQAAAEAASEALQASENSDHDDEDRWSELCKADEEATAALEAAEAQLVLPDPRAAELAGVVVSINSSGDMETHTGLIRPEDKAKVRSLEPKAEGGQGVADAAPGQADPTTLRLQLSALRTLAVQDALANNADAALRVLAYTLLDRYSAERVWEASGVGVGVRADNITHEVTSLAREVAPEAEVIERMGRREQELHDQLPEASEVLWQWCMVEATDAEVRHALAFVVARSVDGLQRHPNNKDCTAALAKHLQVDMRQHWTPSAAYFNRVRKSDTLAMLAERGVSDATLHKLRRDALAEQAAQRLAGTGWLPPTLRDAA